MEKPEIAGTSSIKLEMESGTYWWCACGKSKNQPFCDGSHKGTAFTPQQVELKEAKRISWCSCKRTKSPPYCDNSHREL